MYPRHPTDPYGLQRMERVKTVIGAERLCNQVFRELGLGEPTRAELRAERRDERNQQLKLTPQEIDKNAIVIHRFACAAPALREPDARLAGKALILFCLPR